MSRLIPFVLAYSNHEPCEKSENYKMKNSSNILSLTYKTGALTVSNSLSYRGSDFRHLKVNDIHRLVKIEFNIKVIATQTFSTSVDRFSKYKYCVKTLIVKSVHKYNNFGVKFGKIAV